MATRQWIALSAVLIVGCGLAIYAARDRSNGSRAPENRGPSDRGATLPPLPAIDRGLIDDDPATDGWDSEAFASATGQTWSKLARLMTRGDITARDLAPLVETEFTTTALLPPTLVESGAHGSIRVVRGEPDRVKRAGAPAWRAALEACLSELGPGSRRVEFKTIDTAPIESARETLVRVELFCHAGGASGQQVAHWRCAWNDAVEPRLRSVELVDWEAAHVDAPTGTLLADCTQAVVGRDPAFRDQLRIGSEEWMTRLDAVLSLETYGHHGVAIADVNGDGLDDVHIAQPWGLPNRLFRQNPDGTATDVAQEAGLDWLEPSYGALFLDLDNDGDPDLVVATNAELSVFENDGTGRFERRALLPLRGSALSLAASDPDGDGDVDVYACVYYPPNMKIGQLAQPVPYHDANNGGRNVFWRNEGSFRFTDATAAVGLDSNNSRWSFAAAFGDYDSDGDEDLYVANDFGRNNLYRNDGGRFTDVARAAAVEDASFGMAASWGDYDRDGDLDLHVANMFSAAGHRVTSQRRFKRNVEASDRARYRYLARGNSLFRNRGDGTFDDVSAVAGIGMGRWSWASIFHDIDNDGWPDVLVANGFLTNERIDDL